MIDRLATRYPDGTTKTKREYYDYFEYMTQEDKKEMLGGMAWDDIDWHFYEAVKNRVCTEEELKKDFPYLFDK